MLPIVMVPETIRRRMAPYREMFCREAGFDQWYVIPGHCRHATPDTKALHSKVRT